jgi:hypothetical protein
MVCDDKWHSVVRVLFFILDEVFSVNNICFVKTMVNARIVVTPLFQMTFQFPNPFFGGVFVGDMKWTESEENLNRFFDHANNVHPTIKFTHETSRNNISFLDTYTTCFVKTMVNARIVVAPLFQMTFQFPKPFFGGLIVGADAFDSESLAVRNTFAAMLIIYPTSFVSTGQPYKNTQNCVKSSKNHPSWPSGNPKV